MSFVILNLYDPVCILPGNSIRLSLLIQACMMSNYSKYRDLDMKCKIDVHGNGCHVALVGFIQQVVK